MERIGADGIQLRRNERRGVGSRGCPIKRTSPPQISSTDFSDIACTLLCKATDLNLELNQVQTSSGQALADLDRLAAAVEHSRESLRTALLEAERAAFLAQYDPEALREFFTKPYVVRPIGADEFELIVPKFIGSLGGWPVRTDGAFLIFRVSRFIHLINPLPAWLADELGYKATPFHATLDGNTLIVDRGDPQAAYEALSETRTVTRREGDRLFFRPANRLEIIRQIIRQYGFLPYTPQPVPSRSPSRGQSGFHAAAASAPLV